MNTFRGYLMLPEMKQGTNREENMEFRAGKE